ncbi:MAG: GSCFA domain-containing protein [Reyranella sp.]|nr:MAG: GSCFA domain-containing protein [Reyranella sp.]
MQPPTAFWRRSVAEVAPGEVDPVVGWKLKIGRDTKVATAGSCFAQHIARRLRSSGYHYFVSEQPPIKFGPEITTSFNYGTFSARYGNIYTSRQLLQLIQRAYGLFKPVDDMWTAADGSIIDPYRPTIQPGGFPTLAEFKLSREQHLAAVRRMFEELDVFVFTLGLTECWTNVEDGAAYPICPGASGGTFDPKLHKFVNLDVADVCADMKGFAELLRRVNPNSKIMLTVSPVPLVATAEAAHVLTATTYSKSVLRVAAQTLANQLPEVHYFPSYEIITGPHARGAYYAEDAREVVEDGVAHVMRTFFAHATSDGTTSASDTGGPAAQKVANRAERRRIRQMRRLFEVICDEKLLDSN